VLTDVKAKFHATAIAAKKIELESEVDKFLEKICGLEDNLSEQVALLSVAYGPPDGQTLVPSAQDAYEKARWKLDDLDEELFTYLNYVTTILQFFRNTLTEQMLINPPKCGSLDHLAKARQMLAISPGITRAMLHMFCAAHGLNCAPDWPVPRAPSTNDFWGDLRRRLRPFVSTLTAQVKSGMAERQ
jgi:hypothetical protein